MNVLTNHTASLKFKRARFNFLFTTSLTVISLFIFASTAFAQGFGRSQMTVRLGVKYAPKIYLSGTNLQIKIAAKDHVNPRFLQRLQEQLETTLSLYDWRLDMVANSPETLLTCAIEQLFTTSRPGVKTRQVYRAIGSHTVYDSTGVSQTVQDFGYVQENYNVTTIEGRTTVDYQLTDVATGSVLDEDAMIFNFKQDYETDPPGTQVAAMSMIDNLVQNITTRFLPIFNPTIVNLPKGELKEISYYLQDGMWNSAIAKLNAHKPFKNPEDEAYRLYALGVAYEGLANESPDLASTKINFEKAASLHDKASQLNYNAPDFQEAAIRVSRILQSYKKLEGAIRDYEAKRQRKGLKVFETAKIYKHFGTSNVLTNELVIKWAKAGVKDEEIMKRIRNLRVKYFDLSDSGIAELQQSGVSAEVIDEMRRTMLPRQNAQKSKRDWVGTAVGYALAFYPYTFRFR
ncbi:MAG: hypothetical protein AB1757_12550 [Acidobacteriota bacterium]